MKLNTSLENIKKYQLMNYKTLNKNYQSYKYNFNELMNYLWKKQTNFNELILLKKNFNELMNYSRFKADNYLSQVSHGQTYLKQ